MIRSSRIIVNTAACTFLTAMGEQDVQNKMDKEEWFNTVCRLMNKILEQREDEQVEIRVEGGELKHLLAALEYYRGAVNPSSGDVLIGTEYVCPGCGSKEVFRAQEGQVSTEEKHPAVGVEVVQVDGIAQCSECKLQVNLNQFERVKLDGFNENAWEDLFEEQYQEKEVVEKLQSK